MFSNSFFEICSTYHKIHLFTYLQFRSFLGYSRLFNQYTNVILEYFYYSQKIVLISSRSYFFHQTTFCLYGFADSGGLEVSCKWNCTICGCVCVYLAWRYGWRCIHILSCISTFMYIRLFVYSFITWWTLGLFPLLTVLNNAAWAFVYNFLCGHKFSFWVHKSRISVSCGNYV